MLTKDFKDYIMEEYRYQIPNATIDTDKQKSLIKKHFVTAKKKNIVRTDKFIELISAYEKYKSTIEDKEVIAECDEMTRWLKSEHERLKKRIFTDFNDFYRFISENIDEENYKCTLHNFLILLLMAYEGIVGLEDLSKLTIDCFEINVSERKTEPYINVEGKIIPIHIETYNFVKKYCSKSVETYLGENNKSYHHYPADYHGRMSIFRTREKDFDITEKKIDTIKKNCQGLMKEFGLDTAKVHRYGRFEVMFELELSYATAKSVTIKSFDKFIEYCFGILFNVENIPYTISSFRKEYLKWREYKLESLLVS